jgi:hypothetical protein
MIKGGTMEDINMTAEAEACKKLMAVLGGGMSSWL